MIELYFLLYNYDGLLYSEPRLQCTEPKSCSTYNETNFQADVSLINCVGVVVFEVCIHIRYYVMELVKYRLLATPLIKD